MMRAMLVATCALLASFASPALAVQDCEMNGEHVNPTNGNTTAGKSGIMKCRDRDTRQARCAKRNTATAARWAIASSSIFRARRSSANYNEMGNRDGESKKFDADGTLLAHERYVNGSNVGVQTYYYKNKQIKRLSYSERNRSDMASIEYNERGQLTELRCSDKPCSRAI